MYLSVKITHCSAHTYSRMYKRPHLLHPHTGNNVCKTLAFACMDALIQIDSNHTWIEFMNKSGYLGSIARRLVAVMAAAAFVHVVTR